MPTVPRYERTVSPGSLQGGASMPRVTGDMLNPAAGIEKLGQGLQQGAASPDKVGVDRQEELNKRVVTDSLVSAEAEANNLVIQGRNRLGRNAAGLTTETTWALGTTYQKATKGMNERQKELFDARWSSVQLGTLKTTALHEQDQQQKADVAAEDAMTQNALTRAVTSYTDPEARKEAMESIGLSLRRKGDLLGWDADTLEANRAKAYSNVNEAMVRQALADDRLDDAESLLADAQSKAQIDPAFHSQASKAIKEQRDTKLGMDYGEDIAAKGMGLREGLEDIGRKFEDNDTAMRQAKAAFKQMVSIARNESREAYQNYLFDSLMQVDNLVANDDYLTAQQFVRNMPVLTPEDRKAKGYAESRLNQYTTARHGTKWQTPLDAWGEILDGIGSGTITTEAQVKAYAEKGVHSSDLNSAIKMLQGAQKYVVRDLKDAYLTVVGKETLSTKRDRADFAAFQRYMGETIRETNKGGDLDFYRKAATRWKTSGEVPGKWSFGYGPDKTFGKAFASGEIETWLPDVPSDEAATIKAAFMQSPQSQSVWRQWVDRAGGDEDMAMRMYYRATILRLGMATTLEGK